MSPAAGPPFTLCVHHSDEGGHGGDGGGGAGSAGPEQSPSEVKRGLPSQMFRNGSAPEGRRSTERTGEGWSKVYGLFWICLLLWQTNYLLYSISQPKLLNKIKKEK